MSKKSKSAAKVRRKSLKAGRKSAEKARYAAFAASGSNSKRSKARNKRASGMVQTKRHADGLCGNIGCIRCSGNDTKVRMNDSSDPRVRLHKKR